MSTPFYDLASLVVVPSGYKASKVYAQKPQTTDGQLAFTRSTTATRVNSAGLIEASAVNVPRLDYLGSTCPRLLLEPQRSNLLTFSEQFDNAAWTKLFLGVTANNASSPDGTTNAEKLIPDATLNTHLFFQSLTPAAGVYTQSAFFKAGEYNFACLRLSTDSDTKRFAVVLDLTTGLITATNSLGSPTSTSSKVENYGNGWYCLSISSAHASGTMFPTFAVSSTAVPTFSNSLPLFTGNGTSGIYVYGAQLEVGAYATSYIPTSGAAVTRVADSCSKTGITSLIGQTSGTVFLDFVLNSVGNIFNTNQNVSNTIVVNSFGNNRIQARIWASGVLTTINATPEYALGSNLKIALKYSSGDIKLFINGVVRGSSTNTLTFNGAINTIFLNESTTTFATGSLVKFNSLLLFQSVLTDAQCIDLTA